MKTNYQLPLSIIAMTVILLTVIGCSTYSGSKTYSKKIKYREQKSASVYTPPPKQHENNATTEKGMDVVFYSLSLMDTKYKFGGKNPSAGLDCSGLVSYVYKNAINQNLNGNAASQAKQGKRINRTKLRPGDLVFFNTTGKPYSHVGIYVGENRFIHSPNSHGAVRLQSLAHAYWGKKVIGYRSYFN